MSQSWKGKITLVGSKLPTTTKTFDLQVDEAALIDAQFTQALAQLAAIEAALLAVTDAIVGRSWVTHTVTESGILGAGDTTDEARISCYINDALEVPKHAILAIPAPSAAIFTAGDANKVDEGDADVIAYVAAVANNAFVSDGEQINLAIDNGIKDGYWASRARSMRP